MKSDNQIIRNRGGRNLGWLFRSLHALPNRFVQPFFQIFRPDQIKVIALLFKGYFRLFFWCKYLLHHLNVKVHDCFLRVSGRHNYMTSWLISDTGNVHWWTSGSYFGTWPQLNKKCEIPSEFNPATICPTITIFYPSAAVKQFPGSEFRVYAAGAPVNPQPSSRPTPRASHFPHPTRNQPSLTDLRQPFRLKTPPASFGRTSKIIRWQAPRRHRITIRQSSQPIPKPAGPRSYPGVWPGIPRSWLDDRTPRRPRCGV